jgi:cytochrome c oxidase subunit 3
MIAVMNEQKSRLHPYKFNMWIALAGIVMMFAGLSSAYIVKRNQANWLTFDIPLIFWYSTAVIVLSSVTIILSRKAFVNRQMRQYQNWLGITTLLGIAFVTMQFFGFMELWNNGITITRNVSFSFLYVIVGVHALHVIGGIVALLILYIRSFTKRTRVYNSLSIDLMGTYWHFVDLLWLYLLIFLVVIR